MYYLLTNLYPTKSSITLDKIKLWTTTHPTIEACGKWLVRIAVDTSFLALFVCQHYSVDHGHGSLNQICLHWTTFQSVYDSGHCQLHNSDYLTLNTWLDVSLPHPKNEMSSCQSDQTVLIPNQPLLFAPAILGLIAILYKEIQKAQNEEAFCITDLINSSLLANHHTSLGTSLLHFGRF